MVLAWKKIIPQGQALHAVFAYATEKVIPSEAEVPRECEFAGLEQLKLSDHTEN